jgi:hypothetical protein
MRFVPGRSRPVRRTVGLGAYLLAGKRMVARALGRACPRCDRPRLARADKPLAEDNKTFSKSCPYLTHQLAWGSDFGPNVGLRWAIFHGG